MDDGELEELYSWIDEIPLSRPKRNITRDFSDGVLVAEVIHHHIPRLIELHNYQPASSVKQKIENWRTLQRKALKKLRLTVPENVLHGVTNQKAGVVEIVLNNLRLKIDQYLSPEGHSNPRAHSQGSQASNNSPEEDISFPKPTSLQSAPTRNVKSRVKHSPLKQPSLTARSNTRSLAPPSPRISNSPRVSKKEPNQSEQELYTIIEEQKTELLDCKETIGILQLKISKLEKLLELKDQKINDLSKRKNGR